MEKSEIDPHQYSQLIFPNRAKIDFSTNGARTTGHAHKKKRKKCRYKPYTLQKINLKWVTTYM